ncbi:CDP-glycerol glycerophosphotransferase family protein [Eubacterium ruminantium]|uniref:CDP-glycerol glycerophosphotransferase family protein n=1 Tax=Eubacterium ruminantium TaxID=42322 RepID=UPI0015694E67|nr:CDP-glycerol glycerophosphotransferase family protein [Eubacterium ruminantium]
MEYYVNKIVWDRIWILFNVDFISESEDDIYLVNSDNTARFLLKKGSKPSEYKLNITNPGNCAMLPPGIYTLKSSCDLEGSDSKKQILSPLLPSKDLDISNLNRQFIYFHKERSYRVQFSVKNGLKIKISDIRLKSSSFSGRIRSFIRDSKNKSLKSILRAIYNFEYIKYHKKNYKSGHSPNILLMSDQSEHMGSNMSALKDRLISRGYKPYEALRAITTKHYSFMHWIKTLKSIARADYIFLDDHSQTTDWLKIKGAVITQLWHAGAGFKATGYARFGMPASPAPYSGHRQYTYGIAGSLKIRHFFSEVWGINDEMVLPTGMPRIDVFLNENHISKAKTLLYKKLADSTGLDITTLHDKKIMLFAPTYRGENKRHAYYPYDKLNFDDLYKLCKNKNYIVIFKMHPFVETPVPIPAGYKDLMIDMTSYENINDLFYITDLLITDYSSNIYEFSLMKKPMLFYSFDIKEYSKERGFHRDYLSNVPGKVVESFSDLLKAISDENFQFEKVSEYIDNNFEYIDAHACDRIIDIIIENKKDIIQ